MHGTNCLIRRKIAPNIVTFKVTEFLWGAAFKEIYQLYTNHVGQCSLSIIERYLKFKYTNDKLYLLYFTLIKYNKSF